MAGRRKIKEPKDSVPGVRVAPRIIFKKFRRPKPKILGEIMRGALGFRSKNDWIIYRDRRTGPADRRKGQRRKEDKGSPEGKDERRVKKRRKKKGGH